MPSPLETLEGRTYGFVTTLVFDKRKLKATRAIVKGTKAGKAQKRGKQIFNAGKTQLRR